MPAGKYFSHDELKCKHCGQNHMSSLTISKLDNLREMCGPLILNSAYRCPEYNTQIGATQTHASGQAVDIRCSGFLAFEILRLAASVGFTGIGIQQKGDHAKRFIHLDDLSNGEGIRPTVWSYH